MKFVEKMFYNIRNVIPTIGMAGLTMMPVACAKVDLREDPEPEVEIPVVQRDTVFEFNRHNGDEVLNMDTLLKYINDKTIGNIYLVPTGHWSAYTSINISKLRSNFFQQRMDLSPKMHGRGDFDFELGEASKVPNDRLWFVQQGWTINKAHQK